MATQLIHPNPDIECIPGMCLKYVHDTFYVRAKYPSAIAAWNASKYKHKNYSFPDGVAIPLWFSLSDNPHGHVVLRMADGTIWSSSHPTSNIPVHHPSLLELEAYYSGRLQFLGWTEDIEDVQVVDLGAESVLSSAAINNTTNTPASLTATPSRINRQDILRMMQDGTYQGVFGYTGHRPDHPAIEHMKINHQKDAEIAKKKNKPL